MKLYIIAVGSLKESYWQAAIAEYTKRIKKFADIEFLEIKEVKEQGNYNLEYIKKAEAEAIIKHLKGISFVLDLKGQSISSEEMAKVIDTEMTNGQSTFSFVIGGSNGLDASVLKKADYTINFGKITFPHQLIRVVLTEQLYRVMTINNNIKYHK